MGGCRRVGGPAIRVWTLFYKNAECIPNSGSGFLGTIVPVSPP